MRKKHTIAFYVFIAIDIAFVAIVAFLIFGPYAHFGNFAVLSPKGVIAAKERSLMVTVISLMLIVVVPVFFLLFFIAWKYRAGKKSEYSPDMQSSFAAGSVLWAIPAIIIFAIGVLNWKSTHALDPYKAIASDKKPITIQVVALQWKWLFIYPEAGIATINYIQFPENTPLHFELTADAPMNSFWIPELGGQMYAMPGMSTQLHLMANQTGEFKGSTAEISGPGFAGMRFVAKSSSQEEFDAWVKEVKSRPNILSFDEYGKLAKPSENNPKAFYSSVDNSLYHSVIMKFMPPAQTGGMR